MTRARMLGLFETTMVSAHTRLTEADLKDKKYATNGTGRLLRLMSMLFDTNPEESFEKVAPEYFKYFEGSPFARNCISLMVRYYATWIVPQSNLLSKKKFLLSFFNDELVNETIKGLMLSKQE